MSTITWSPLSAQTVNNSPNTIVIGGPGKGQKFYLDENGNKIEEDIEKYISKLKEEN